MGNSRLTAAVCAVGLLLAGCGVSPSINSTPSFHPSTTPPQPENPSSQGEDEGIWFDEEPAEPLERLVYASQRFVDDPLELQLIEGEGVDPAFVGKPDICDPRATERLGELGIQPPEDMSTYMDNIVYVCNYQIYYGDTFAASTSISLPNFSVAEHTTKKFTENLVELSGGGPEFDCIALLNTESGEMAYTTYEDLTQPYSTENKKRDLPLIRQLFINIQGGTNVRI